MSDKDKYRMFFDTVLPIIMSISPCIESQISPDPSKTEARGAVVTASILRLKPLEKNKIVVWLTRNYYRMLESNNLNHSSQVAGGKISPSSPILFLKQGKSFPGKIHSWKIC